MGRHHMVFVFDPSRETYMSVDNSGQTQPLLGWPWGHVVALGVELGAWQGYSLDVAWPRVDWTSPRWEANNCYLSAPVVALAAVDHYSRGSGA